MAIGLVDADDSEIVAIVHHAVKIAGVSALRHVNAGVSSDLANKGKAQKAYDKDHHLGQCSGAGNCERGAWSYWCVFCMIKRVYYDSSCTYDARY